MVEPSGSLKVTFRMPVPVLYEEDTRAGGMPSITVSAGVADATGLPCRSETAPADTDRVGASPAVSLWVVLRVAVMVWPEWLLEATASRVTLWEGPVRVKPV